MSIDRMIDDFKNTFSTNVKSDYLRKENIKKIWEENPQLQDILKGKSIYEGDLEYKIFLNEQLKIFRKVLSSRYSYIICEVWEDNERLHDWYSGKPVVINGVHQTIPFDDLLADYREILISTYSPIARFIWQNNAVLRAWLSGNYVVLDGVEQTITLEEMLLYFKSVLSSRCQFVIDAIWNANEKLRKEFLEPSSFGILVKNFRSALSSRNRDVIEVMWNIPSLKQWLTGGTINFGTDTHSKFRQISNRMLIIYFKSILSTQQPYIIDEMWRTNSALRQAIKSLPQDDYEKLFKKVMSSSKLGKSDFINQYIIWMNDIDLVKSLLKEMDNHFLEDELYARKRRKIEEIQGEKIETPVMPINNWYRNSHSLLFSDNNVPENDVSQIEKVEEDNIILDQTPLDHFSFYSNCNMQELEIIEQEKVYDKTYWVNF